MLGSWLNSINSFEGVDFKDIMTYERTNAIDYVYHEQEGHPKEFFYIYIAFFIKLHVHLPIDEFIMEVTTNFECGSYPTAPKQLGLHVANVTYK